MLIRVRGVYQSEGFPLTGYFIPGRVGSGSGTSQKLLLLLLLSVGFRPAAKAPGYFLTFSYFFFEYVCF